MAHSPTSPPPSSAVPTHISTLKASVVTPFTLMLPFVAPFQHIACDAAECGGTKM